ncbi:hypothetical protein HHI36_000656 [Cryptolaemus montrouzieri]|uniref:Integrin alpha second immunoglobulin-like domain-containing protein n=1 Tax=Cryptolaemus montrouzieri TaxID=559131 RepID=A0ABD2P550_9CUCU
MTNLLLYIFLFLASVTFQCVSFNIDVDNPIVYLDQSKYLPVKPSNKSSFFGLSVILYPGDKGSFPWIQIGAPRSNSPNVQFKNPGTIFRCDIGGLCRNLEVDKTPFQSKKLDDAWIGATMDINLNIDRLVVCAPRWMNIYERGSQKDYRMYGACYWSHLNTSSFTRMLPLYTNFDQDLYTTPKTRNSVYNYGQGESGLSVHMPLTEKELLIGAPGVYNWKGTSIRYKDIVVNDFNPVASRYSTFDRQEKINDDEIFQRANVANARTTTETLAFGLFGYSVTSGYFYSKMSLYYASGAPRSENYYGQVVIYDFQKDNDQRLMVKDTKRGTQFGEYFGASIAAGDIDNDGLDDLFVGAPFYKNTRFNEGRIYVFLGNKKGLKEPPKGETVEGTQMNGQFGAAITYLGDMNNDINKSYQFKPKYVAVSAPYEDESGVVYIFRGIPFQGLDTVPVQRIVGKSILPDLKGFGISISKPADIDLNGYGDIAIGAFQSGHTVLLRSKPLVSVETYFNYTPNAISQDNPDFQVTVCHRYYSFKGMPSIRINRTIIVDEDFNRAFMKDGAATNELNITVFAPSCEKITISLRKSLANVYDPLSLKVTHTYIPEKTRAEKTLISNKIEGADYFCIRCGEYDEYTSTKMVTKYIPFILGCGDDDICTSKLDFMSTFKGTGVRNGTFILGSTNVIELETTVENTGEKAYLLRLQVDLPKEISLKQTPTLCQQNETKIICSLANPLDTNKKTPFSLKLDMDLINRRIVDDFVNIEVKVLTNSINENKDTKIVRLDLKTEADITISGISGEQSYSYATYGNGTKGKVPFKQTYQIGKYGLSPVSLIKFEIMVPYALKTKSGNIPFISLYQPEGHLEGGQSLIFKSDIRYLEETQFGSAEGMDQEDTAIIRSRRAIDTDDIEQVSEASIEVAELNTSRILSVAHMPQENSEASLLGNKTVEITCNTKDVICGIISGKAGPFEGLKKAAVLQIRMIFDIEVVAGLLQENSVVRYSTFGRVEIEDPPNLIQSGKRPDSVSVSSLFVNDAVRKTVALWIFIVSIIAGLLLVLLLTLVLTKAGFFKRTKKEELEQLKAQAGIDNTEGTITEAKE